MSVTSLVTSGPGAATELMAQLDLAAVDLLLFVGGDGTVYEGLQVRSWRNLNRHRLEPHCYLLEHPALAISHRNKFCSCTSSPLLYMLPHRACWADRTGMQPAASPLPMSLAAAATAWPTPVGCGMHKRLRSPSARLLSAPWMWPVYCSPLRAGNTSCCLWRMAAWPTWISIQSGSGGWGTCASLWVPSG